MINPYLTLPSISAHLQSRGYPPEIINLVYPEATRLEPKGALDGYNHLWFHPDQISSDTGSRPTGHDVHRMLIEKSLVYKCLDFRTLTHLQKYPEFIPLEWVSLGVLALAWRSTAYNMDGDMCVPHLNCREKIPIVRWRPLALRINGAEATPITIF